MSDEVRRLLVSMRGARRSAVGLGAATSWAADAAAGLAAAGRAVEADALWSHPDVAELDLHAAAWGLDPPRG